jgi:hypothetical protein
MNASDAIPAPAPAAATRARPPLTFPVVAGLATSVLVAVSALAGILAPGTYARETASLAAQGIGQDWVDLIAVAPMLALAALALRSGSRRARLLLAGGLAYAAYSYAIYAFGVHFNAMFLIYCGVLGCSAFGLASLCAGALRDDPRAWYAPGAPRRAAGWLLLAIAAVFAVLWLGEIVPALGRGEAPVSVARDNLLTNPVHVLDLALVLPAVAWAGVGLLRDRSAGWFFGPVLLIFAGLMALAIGGMVVALWVAGLATDAAVAIAFAGVAVGCGWTAARMLARLR